jgi:hypothetical protein
MKRALWILILLTPLHVCLSQKTGLNPDSKVLGDGKIIRKTVFDGNSLWGYINGGADIYLEYGFKNLLLHEIEYKGNVIRFDLYQMSDPRAAFGIFSVYSYTCDDVIGPGTFNCLTKWQIQVVKNDYYLSVILPTGSSDEQMYAKEIAEELLASVDETGFEPGYPFAEGRFSDIKADIKYARGRLGIDNGISLDIAMTEGVGFSELWQITDIEGYDNVTVTLLSFAETNDCSRFAEMQKALDNTDRLVSVLSDGLTIILIKGISNKEDASGIYDWFSEIEF